MVHVVFDTSLAGYGDLFLNQTGGGGGTSPLDGLGTIADANAGDPPIYIIFKGTHPYQRGWGIQGGAGISDVLRGLWRFFSPLLRKVGTTVTAEALNTGQRVLDRVANEGAPIKDTLITEGKRGIDQVLEKGGLPKQFGSGRKRSTIKRKRAGTKPSFLSHQTLIGRAVKPSQGKKRVRQDTFGQTFINNMRIAINGREIFNSNSLMAYKTYFSHELSFPIGAKDSHLNAEGYYRDMELTLEAGLGFNSRRDLFYGSKTAQFISKIDADLFNQPQYLINHCELDITIQPNETNFVLIAPAVAGQQQTRYHFEVTGLKLYCKKLSLMDGLALQLARKLEMKPARYAVRKTLMKALFVSPGRFEFNANLFMDQVPRRVTLGLVSNADYVGNIARSPFNFYHYNVRDISIIANGRSYPQARYDLDYENRLAIRPFLDTNEAIGFANSLESNGINYAQFMSTHCIYVFNLTNSGDDQGGMFDLIKKGSTAVCIKFREAVPAGGLMLIVMGEADSLYMVDKNRDVATDTTI